MRSDRAFQSGEAPRNGAAEDRARGATGHIAGHAAESPGLELSALHYGAFPTYPPLIAPSKNSEDYFSKVPALDELGTGSRGRGGT
jgi:hypothetical protein